MEFLSIVAAICSTSASLPQLFTHQKMNTFSLLLRGAGGISWSIYGLLRAEWALFASSTIVFIIECILYIKHRKALASVLKGTSDNGPYPTDVQEGASSLETT